MAGAAKEARFAVRVDERWLSDDLEHATDAGSAAIEPVIDELQSGGVAADTLRPCEDDARDGTQLAGCVKLYIPPPAGRWGAVFTIDGEASGVAPGFARPADGKRLCAAVAVNPQGVEPA